MSFSIDTSILLHASDRGSAYQQPAAAFLADCASAPDLFYLAWPAIIGYLRIATHRGIFASPLSPQDARQNIQSLLDLPHVRTLGEEEGFWDVFRGVSDSFVMRGNDMPDAHLAALLRQHGVTTLYTNDAGFKRFSFLRVVNPFEERPAR